MLTYALEKVYFFYNVFFYLSFHNVCKKKKKKNLFPDAYIIDILLKYIYTIIEMTYSISFSDEFLT